MLKSDFWYKSFTDPAIFWVAVTGVATLLLILVAWKQLGDLKKTSKADFMFRLKMEFFTPKTRRLVFLVEENLIRFVTEPVYGFEIVADEKKYGPVLKEFEIKEKFISSYAIDDDLLGPLEDAGLLLEIKAITEKEAYEVFYTYVRDCAKNSEVQKYIADLRKNPEEADIYSAFDSFYRRLTKHSRTAIAVSGRK